MIKPATQLETNTNKNEFKTARTQRRKVLKNKKLKLIDNNSEKHIQLFVWEYF